MVNRIRSALTLACLISPFVNQSWAQDKPTSYQVGIVYYADQGGFKALDKEVAVQSGRKNYSARVKGAYAAVRLPSGHPQLFRVCSVDPSRFKLYRFKSETNARSVTLAKINIWVGGSKTVAQESEIPMTIQPSDGGCFTLAPQKVLEDGEFGFSPDGSFDAFMFGVGMLKDSK